MLIGRIIFYKITLELLMKFIDSRGIVIIEVFAILNMFNNQHIASMNIKMVNPLLHEFFFSSVLRDSLR